MCTTFSTRNRAVIMNNYSVQTLLLDRNAYCPYGPNTQDFTQRSRLYNPDPKYQCHSDLTCHQFDSIPKNQSACGPYGAPQFNCCGGSPATTIPCISPGGGCSPPGDNQDCYIPPPPACQRRRIKPPGCCEPRPTYKDLIESMQCCAPSPCCPCPPSCCPPPCCPSSEEGQDEACDGEDDEEQNRQPESCYSLVVPPEMGDCCGSKVTYNFGPTGITRSVQTRGGNHQICMPCQNDCVMLETHGGPGGCCIGNSGIRVESKYTPLTCCVPPPPCCPPPPRASAPCCLPCPRPCPPPPCRFRKRIRCSPFMRTTVGPDIGCGCQCMEFRPRFQNP